jgi:uncharacterized protein
MEDNINELKQILGDIKPFKAILFGSYAYETQTNDSDIDLIVVLNKNDMPKNFNERIQNYSFVKNYFKKLKYKVPMDIIVYTKKEWFNFLEANNSFTNEILEKGKILI